MLRTAPLRLLAGSSLAVAALLTACGGDDGEDAAVSATTEVEVIDDITEGTDDATGSTADDEPAGDRDPFCDAYDDIDDATEGLANDTIEDMRTGAEAVQAAVSAAQAEVPSEIEEEFSVLAGSIDDLRQFAEDSDTVEEFQTAIGDYDTTEVDAAGETVDAWYDDNC